jgi:hypothetical protein
MRRGITTALVVSAMLVVIPAASARPAAVAYTTSYIIAWRQLGAKVVRHTGHYYAQWQCDVGGTIVASGAWWIWMSPGATALGMLAGLSFTVGCHIGAPDAPSYYMNGVPYVTQPCVIVYPQGSYRRRFEVCQA